MLVANHLMRQLSHKQADKSLSKGFSVVYIIYESDFKPLGYIYCILQKPTTFRKFDQDTLIVQSLY